MTMFFFYGVFKDLQSETKLGMYVEMNFAIYERERTR